MHLSEILCGICSCRRWRVIAVGGFPLAVKGGKNLGGGGVCTRRDEYQAATGASLSFESQRTSGRCMTDVRNTSRDNCAQLVRWSVFEASSVIILGSQEGVLTL